MNKLAIILMFLAGVPASAEFTVNMPQPQGGKVICKSGQMSSFIQETVNEIANTAEQIAQAVKSNKDLRKELETGLHSNFKIDLSDLGRTQSKVETSGNFLSINISLILRSYDKGTLVRYGVLQNGQATSRTIVIKASDDCVVSL